MSNNVAAITPCETVNARIRPPGSKSITNRAVICAVLANGNSYLTGVLDSDDTRAMIDGWKQVGASLQHDVDQSTLQVAGTGGQLTSSDAEIFVGNSGTTVRFMSAALAACHASGSYLLDGVARMRQRPIGDLIETLTQLGGNITPRNEENPSCPPVQVAATGLAGGAATIAGNLSSQFLSAAMMAAPIGATATELHVEGELVSLPYVRMTSAVMKAFGATTELSDDCKKILINSTGYQAANYEIEPDASAASYFWAAAAIAGGSATVEGLTLNSLQGDVHFCRALEKMGCQFESGENELRISRSGALRGIEIDMGDISDTVQSLSAVALFAEGPTTIRGVAHNRVKETDRITDLARELIKLGAHVEEFEDGLRIEPPAKVQPATIETYDDHRMAMSLSLVGLRRPGIEILNPGCTAKTYPGFWNDLKSFTGCSVHIRS